MKRAALTPALALPLAALALAAPSAAFADATIQAVDESGAGPNHWNPDTVTVKVGETVTWSFAGTGLVHNVKSESGWDLSSPFAVAGAAVTHVFTTPGTYKFYCQLHQSTMFGEVRVTDETGAPPPPPPPPPLSEQSYANDAPPVSVFEVRDKVRPRLDRVKVTRARHAAKVRFRLSEAGKVKVTLTRGKLTKSRTVTVRRGTSTVTVSGLRPGAYRVSVTARDLAGNRAKAARRARITVRG
ncbi:MAG TPA: plastocyanin/azurin family copper-binding protein [Solirubrobacter sp.]|nr:plastocyanin/azurin family copper-binding protein [Solirubrobacter sp.]